MGIVRKTKSVQALLNIFEENYNAISAVHLVASLSQEMNKTTIYRILDRLENEGVVHSFLGKDGLKWYAKCQGCSSKHHEDVHPHFQCSSCGKVDCLTAEVKIPKVPNRTIEFSQVLLIGKCERCCA